MTVMRRWMTAALLSAVAPVLGAQTRGWAPPKCDLSTGHYDVNGGMLYIKQAAETQFPDQRIKNLQDANRVLLEAITSKGQDKNGAAWYYLGRYYVEMKDPTGADSAFTRAEALVPKCRDDIGLWRRQLWVPAFNAAVAAYTAGNMDSAASALRRANQVFRGEPSGFSTLAEILANKGQLDSAAYYYQLAAGAATDPKFAKDKKEALFNRSVVLVQAKAWADARGALQDYLKSYPGDMKAEAALASVFASLNQPDSAQRIYNELIAHADSADPLDVFDAGVSIYRGVPTEPDTGTMGGQCRSDARKQRPPLTVARIRVRCDSVTSGAERAYRAVADPQYQLAIRAFVAGLAHNPDYRDALFNLTNAYYVTNQGDSMLATARRLNAVDPMSPDAIRLLAGAWQLKNKPDSVLFYLARSDSLLPVQVNIATFAPTDQKAQLAGTVTNQHAKPSAAFQLSVDFLDAKGQVVATQTAAIPAVDPQGTYQFTVTATGSGIVAWRYKRV